MTQALLCLALILGRDLPEQPKTLLVIGLNDNWESKLLHSELTRDWTKPAAWEHLTDKQKAEALARGKELNKTREYISERFDIQFMHWDTGNDLYHRGKPTFPQYKIRENGFWEAFPSRTTQCSTWSLLTLKHIHDSWFDLDVKNIQRTIWEREHKKVRKIVEDRSVELRAFLDDVFGPHAYYSYFRQDLKLVAWDKAKRKWVTILEPIENTDALRTAYKGLKVSEHYPTYVIRGRIDEIYAYKKLSQRGAEIDLELIPEHLLEPLPVHLPFVFDPAKLPWEYEK